MRYHPAVYHNFRQAAKDDVLPLSRSITTTAGEVLSELPIPEGLKVILSISGYNRSVDTLLSIRIVGDQGSCYLWPVSLSPCVPVTHPDMYDCDCQNRNQEIFGQDANIFNPERWFRENGKKQGPSVGVYGNL